jgi:hypothetical protein
MKTTVPPNGGNGNGKPKSKIVATLIEGSDTVRFAIGQQREGGGWDWHSRTGVKAPKLIEGLAFWKDQIVNGGE